MIRQEAGLAGQLTARSGKDDTYWTLRFGGVCEEATPDECIEVDKDLNTEQSRNHSNTIRVRAC